MASNETGSRVLTVAEAKKLFGAAALRRELEATGSSPLQTVRRLNDPTQREKSSAFLTYLGAIVPNANTSQLTGLDNGDGTSTVTVTAGYLPMADGSRFSYPQRQDTIANPAAGAAKVYYYYIELPNHVLRQDGPYTIDSEANRFNSRRDGRILVAVATIAIPAAGGAPEYGGGGGLDPIREKYSTL